MQKLFDTLSALGLAYDVVGVSILAWAIFWANDREIRYQLQSFYDLNSKLYSALFKQRRDVRCGLALTIVGFGLQWIGQGYTQSLPWWLAATVWIILVGTTGLYFLFLRARGLDDAVERALADVLRESKAGSGT